MDFLNSFFQNVKDKLTSPFFGTLSFILIIHHWEFWYTLFNFDKDCTRTEKLATLRLIGANEFGNFRILGDLLLALLIMLAGYTVIMGTRTLSLAIDFRFMPWVTGKVISKNVVERTLHEEIVTDRDQYSEKYEEQRRLVRGMSKDYDSLIDEIQGKNQIINKQNHDISTLQDRLATLETDLASEKTASRKLNDENDILKSRAIDLSDKLITEESKVANLEDNINNLLNVLLSNESIASDQKGIVPLGIRNLINGLKESGNWLDFRAFLRFLKAGGTLDTSVITKMKELGLASKDRGERRTPLAKVIEAYSTLID